MSTDSHFSRTIRNIAQHGDTDVFPYPVENSLFHDCENQIMLLKEIHDNFDKKLNTEPPFNENHLAPVGYSGFRWVTQIDPLWNAYLLGLVASIGDQIETKRISKDDECVFSYRYAEGSDDKFFDE